MRKLIVKSEWQEGKELSAAEWGKPKPFLNYLNVGHRYVFERQLVAHWVSQ